MKKEAMYKRYKNAMPIGTVHLSNTFGLQVYEPDENDKYDCDYVCSWCNGKNEWGFHKHMVHYSTAGRAFIRKGSLRIYLNLVIRTL